MAHEPSPWRLQRDHRRALAPQLVDGVSGRKAGVESRRGGPAAVQVIEEILHHKRAAQNSVDAFARRMRRDGGDEVKDERIEWRCAGSDVYTAEAFGGQAEFVINQTPPARR
jgi:hypothetical protein